MTRIRCFSERRNMVEILVAEMDLPALAKAMGAEEGDLEADDLYLGQEKGKLKGVLCVRDELLSEMTGETLEKLRAAGVPFYGCQSVEPTHPGMMFCSGSNHVIYAPCGPGYIILTGIDEGGNTIPEELRDARRARESLTRARERVIQRGLDGNN